MVANSACTTLACSCPQLKYLSRQVCQQHALTCDRSEANAPLSRYKKTQCIRHHDCRDMRQKCLSDRAAAQENVTRLESINIKLRKEKVDLVKEISEIKQDLNRRSTAWK
jgi:hypothetical protein